MGQYSKNHYSKWNPFGCPGLQFRGNFSTPIVLNPSLEESKVNLCCAKTKVWIIYILSVLLLPITLIFLPLILFI